MSYNISRWTTKELDGLAIPPAAFYTHPRSDWHPGATIDLLSNVVTLNCGCEQSITGEIKNGMFAVSEIDMTGEGSGTFYRWILEPALKESRGVLVAVLIWEGGDSVTRLTVKDGVVSEESIDL